MARWKPQEDEFVFYFTEYGNINYTDWTENINSIRYDYHKGLYEMGNVFQTKEQAEVALAKVKELLLSLHKDYKEMSNKNTCGECKHYIPEMYHCKKHDVMAEAPNTCEDCTAKNISNGDKIRQMANAELAKLIVPKVMFCNGCPVKCKEKNIPQNNQSDPFGVENIEDVCTKRVEAWLNAPAESEGEDE